MFNPLALFDQEALNGFINEGKKYFVRQTFNRARDHFDEGIKGYFLFCHYNDYFRAKEHYDAISKDPNRFLYDWEKPEHKERLTIAAAKPEGFKIYTNTFMPDWERHVTNRIKEKVRAYVRKLGWKPDRGESVNPVFYPHFGEVYVSLRLKGREVRVKFEEIEKII